MTTNDEPLLLSQDRDGVRTLTLNRPRRKNAINPQLWVALRDALDAAGHDPGVRALVLTGSGGSFCSGADISVPEDIHPKYKLQRLTDVALALHELSIPTIAKVTGVAVGAGWNLALGCDLVVATPESTFCQIFSKRGLSIDLGGSWLLPKIVGLQQAKRLALLADTIDAEEACALNLVTWVVSAEEIDAFVTDLANRLAAGPPDRARPHQSVAERGRRPHLARRAGQRGPRAGSQLRHRGHRGGLCRFRAAAGAVVYWSMGPNKIRGGTGFGRETIGVEICVKQSSSRPCAPRSGSATAHLRACTPPTCPRSSSTNSSNAPASGPRSSTTWCGAVSPRWATSPATSAATRCWPPAGRKASPGPPSTAPAVRANRRWTSPCRRSCRASRMSWWPAVSRS